MQPYVLLTLLSSLLFAGGNVLQKCGVPPWIGSMSVGGLLRRPLAFSVALARSPLWTTGLVVTLAAVAVETQALGQGDVSVVKPLSRVQAVFVALIAVWMLRERLRGVEWLGVGTVILGAMALVREPADSLPFAPPTATTWIAAGGVALCVFLLVAATDRRIAPVRPELGLGLATGSLFGLGDVLMKVGTEIARDADGCFDLASSEGIRSLLATPEFHLAVGSTACAFFLQQAAFSRGRVSLVVPLIAVGGTIVVVLLGASLLREPLAPARLLSIGAMIVGTILLSRPPEPEPHRPSPAGG